jgi:hypothetical protein
MEAEKPFLFLTVVAQRLCVTRVTPVAELRFPRWITRENMRMASNNYS